MAVRPFERGDQESETAVLRYSQSQIGLIRNHESPNLSTPTESYPDAVPLACRNQRYRDSTPVLAVRGGLS